jgi:hypothetical protein
VTDVHGKRAFLIMPFDDSLNWLHREIVDAGAIEGVDVRRADNIFSPGVILQQIFQAIDAADAVIAVCTGLNANVFFELGYAWRTHRPILVAQDATSLPFDVAHYRTELYGLPGDPKRTTFATRIRAAIRAAIEEEALPRGERLSSSRGARGRPAVTGGLVSHGSGYRLNLANSGSVDLHQVGVSVPPEATSFHLHSDDLPIPILRPGERVGLPVSLVMAGGPSIFDVTVTALTDAGEQYSQPIKLSA